MNNSIRVLECPPVGPTMTAVLDLQRTAKATVGFLPDQAIRDRAEVATLLVALDGDQVVAYLLYDLPRNEIRIRQLVVAEGSRGRGLAELLVDLLSQRHPQRVGVVLDCRRDFPASGLWPHLGFTPTSERPGRGAGDTVLTRWWLYFGQPTLLTMLADADERPVAALDVSVVIDLADGASTSSSVLQQDWLDSFVRLGVTDEVLVELDKHEDDDVRRAHRTYAQRLDHLHADRNLWQRLLAEIHTAVGAGAARGYASDLRHVARAAAAGARWFVTRDGRFARACGSKVNGVVPIRILDPHEFAFEVDHSSRSDSYRPADLEGTDVVVRTVAPGELDLLARTFTNQRDGEGFRTFRGRLNGLAGDRSCELFVFAGEKQAPLALVVLRGDALLEVELCRAAAGPAQPTIARQLLRWLRQDACRRGSSAVWVRDPRCGEWVDRGLEREGYLAADEGRVALVATGLRTVASLQALVESQVAALPPAVRPQSLDSVVHWSGETDGVTIELIETLLDPVLVMDALMPVFRIPIRPTWAAALFDHSLSAGQLFPRERALGLRCDHVYYRSPAASGGLRAPAHLLWYVSGSEPGSKTIRAISALTEVITGDPDRLHQRFAHLGTWDRATVRAVAKDGEVMALRFTRTQLLPKPVSLDAYRSIQREHVPETDLLLAGPQEVDERVFVEVCRTGGIDAD